MARDVADERARSACGCDWDNIDVMDYVRQSEYQESRRFGTFSVEGQVGLVGDGKSRVSVCVAWNMCMGK